MGKGERGGHKASYLRHRGRLTKGQRRALENAGPQWLVGQGAGVVDWSAEFSRQAPLGVEIGFGMGHALLAWAQAAPAWNLLGIEVYQPGIGALLLRAKLAELSNLRLLDDDAGHALQNTCSPGSLQEVRIFFPDPWPKNRHHKRRLIQPGFVKLLASRLAPGGTLLLATDWQPYARWMLQCLEAESSLANLSTDGFASHRATRPVTRFEARGQRLGHEVWDLAYRKRDSRAPG